MLLLPIYIYSFMNHLFKSCVHLKWVVYLFIIDLQTYFIHSRYKSSSDIHITNMFSEFATCLSISLTVPLMRKNF